MPRAVSRLGQAPNPYAPMPSPQATHGACIEHVPLDGLRHPVCILRGQDRERVLVEAEELAEIAIRARPPKRGGPVMKVGRSRGRVDP
jgi:hypothetical protein